MNLRRLASALIVALTLLVPAQGASAQATCTFTLGFQTLRTLAGNSVVGECLENEHFNTTNGNAEQRTTKGLLVWRKADNFTAFTDGERAWVNGPFGVQVRTNMERFWWEAIEQPVSNWTIDVVRREQYPSPGNERTLKVIVLGFSIRNQTNQSLILSRDDLSLLDTEGRVYLPIWGPLCAATTMSLEYNPGALTPGYTEFLTVAYTVRNEVTPHSLRLRDGNSVLLGTITPVPLPKIQTCTGF